ncbi:MAG TPA: hypothetical protein VMR33_09430 [Candidatus Baltobacteraceae bacterium]|jgi:hypothetical protein|nr:hypothetical protein [Candidatus Baltobacteraceae bacterium]
MFSTAAPIFSCSGQKLTWNWSNPQPHGNDIVDMAWNGTLGVQVCELGRVYTSPDLVDWFPQNSNLTNDLEAVTFFGSRIIIAGASGAVAYSDDGVNFTAGSLHTTNWIVSLAASSNLVVAVGDNGALYTSTDGATWNLQAPPPYLFPYWLLSVAYGNGLFVTTGEQGYIATSKNGTNWTACSIEESYGELEDVAWVDTSGSHTNFPYKGFWTVSDAGDAFYSTTSGASWTQFSFGSKDPSTNVLYTIAADDVTGLLAGNSEARLGSMVSNQLVWPVQIGPALTNVPSWTYYASVLQSDGNYELAGSDGMLVQSYLTNGNYCWNTPYYSPRDWLFQVTQANGLYVAVGDNVRIMTSSDGADWTVEEVPLTNSVSLAETVFNCVGGTTNFLVAAGTRGSLAVSPNIPVQVVETNENGSLFTNTASSLGVIWYSLPAPAGTTNDLAGICVFTNNFFLVGGNGALLSSPDGTNWSNIRSGTSNYLSGIAAFTNGLLVLTGDEGTILTSPDGTNWTSHDSGTKNWLYRLRCVDGHLLAVGEHGTMLTSTDGTNWTSTHSGVTDWLNDAIMISNTCYVVGDQGVVLASTNFVNWTNIGTITTKSLEGAATQNGQLVVVGIEGSILRSQVLPVLTPVNFISFGQSGGYNVFSVAGVVDQQFTLDSSTNLVDWVTGPLQDLIYGDGTLIFYESLPAPPPPGQTYRCTLVP